MILVTYSKLVKHKHNFIAYSTTSICPAYSNANFLTTVKLKFLQVMKKKIHKIVRKIPYIKYLKPILTHQCIKEDRLGFLKPSRAVFYYLFNNRL